MCIFGRVLWANTTYVLINLQTNSRRLLDAGGSMELQVAKGLQFAQVIATKISKLEAEDHHLILDSVNNTLGFWEYYSVLEKVLSVLSTLTTTQKEQTHSDNLIFSKWLQERLQTTQLKLQVLGYQFR